MGTYLVESFVPRAVAASPDEIARLATRARLRLQQGACAARFVQVLALSASELCLCVIEAATREAAIEAVRCAGLTVDSQPETVALIDLGAATSTMPAAGAGPPVAGHDLHQGGTT